MTKKQREQVVELLRCAADDHPTWRDRNGPQVNGLWHASERDYRDPVWNTANRLIVGMPPGCYRYQLLEAAQRVEDGEWP